MSGALISFAIGSVLYGTIEILWRGYTHWTMVLAGGICLTLFYIFNLNHFYLPLWIKCLTGAFIITTVEFSIGCIANLGLGWNVWSYANMPFNLLGQICLMYTFLWFLMGIPMVFLCNRISGL